MVPSQAFLPVFSQPCPCFTNETNSGITTDRKQCYRSEKGSRSNFPSPIMILILTFPETYGPVFCECFAGMCCPSALLPRTHSPAPHAHTSLRWCLALCFSLPAAGGQDLCSPSSPGPSALQSLLLQELIETPGDYELPLLWLLIGWEFEEIPVKTFFFHFPRLSACYIELCRQKDIIRENIYKLCISLGNADSICCWGQRERAENSSGSCKRSPAAEESLVQDRRDQSAKQM